MCGTFIDWLSPESECYTKNSRYFQFEVWYVNFKNEILGPLSAVGDLRATSDASSVTISWSSPFSLDMTGVDPDIWYSVFIYNVTDENNPTAILCINIIETSYTFTPECFNTYNISVVPFNCVGEGESSGNITIYCELHYSVSRYSMYFPYLYSVSSYRAPH